MQPIKFSPTLQSYRAAAEALNEGLKADEGKTLRYNRSKTGFAVTGWERFTVAVHDLFFRRNASIAYEKAAILEHFREMLLNNIGATGNLAVLPTQEKLSSRTVTTVMSSSWAIEAQNDQAIRIAANNEEEYERQIFPNPGVTTFTDIVEPVVAELLQEAGNNHILTADDIGELQKKYDEIITSASKSDDDDDPETDSEDEAVAPSAAQTLSTQLTEAITEGLTAAAINGETPVRLDAATILAEGKQAAKAVLIADINARSRDRYNARHPLDASADLQHKIVAAETGKAWKHPEVLTHRTMQTLRQDAVVETRLAAIPPQERAILQQHAASITDAIGEIATQAAASDFYSNAEKTTLSELAALAKHQSSPDDDVSINVRQDQRPPAKHPQSPIAAISDNTIALYRTLAEKLRGMPVGQPAYALVYRHVASVLTQSAHQRFNDDAPFAEALRAGLDAASPPVAPNDPLRQGTLHDALAAHEQRKICDQAPFGSLPTQEQMLALREDTINRALTHRVALAGIAAMNLPSGAARTQAIGTSLLLAPNTDASALTFAKDFGLKIGSFVAATAQLKTRPDQQLAATQAALGLTAGLRVEDSTRITLAVQLFVAGATPEMRQTLNAWSQNGMPEAILASVKNHCKNSGTEKNALAMNNFDETSRTIVKTLQSLAAPTAPTAPATPAPALAPAPAPEPKPAPAPTSAQAAASTPASATTVSSNNSFLTQGQVDILKPFANQLASALAAPLAGGSIQHNLLGKEFCAELAKVISTLESPPDGKIQPFTLDAQNMTLDSHPLNPDVQRTLAAIAENLRGKQVADTKQGNFAFAEAAVIPVLNLRAYDNHAKTFPLGNALNPPAKKGASPQWNGNAVAALATLERQRAVSSPSLLSETMLQRERTTLIGEAQNHRQAVNAIAERGLAGHAAARVIDAALALRSDSALIEEIVLADKLATFSAMPDAPDSTTLATLLDAASKSERKLSATLFAAQANPDRVTQALEKLRAAAEKNVLVQGTPEYFIRHQTLESLIRNLALAQNAVGKAPGGGA